MVPPYAVPVRRLADQGGNCVIYQRGLGPPQNFWITKKHKQYLEKIGLGKLSDLLSKQESDLPEYHRRVRRAINWFGLSLQDLGHEQQFLATVFSLESVLNTYERDEIITQVADGVAFLCGDSYQKRMKFNQRVRMLYGKRSDLVHGRENWGSLYWVNEGRDLAWKTLSRLIPFLDSVAKDEDFRNYIFEKKYHCDK
jgi:hypothetical protein